MTVNILGTEYDIAKKKYDEDDTFKREDVDGYCDGYVKRIVVCDMATWPGCENDAADTNENAQKDTIRHEIVHAFFNESGLQNCAARYDGPWSKFEECVDWIAIQGPKIYDAWRSVGAV